MNNTPSPKGWALALVLLGSLIALTGSTAALVTGDHSLMGIAATGFAVQFIGWTVNGRRNRGRR
jgi:hypothetical protein